MRSRCSRTLRLCLRLGATRCQRARSLLRGKDVECEQLRLGQLHALMDGQQCRRGVCDIVRIPQHAILVLGFAACGTCQCALAWPAASEQARVGCSWAGKGVPGVVLWVADRGKCAAWLGCAAHRQCLHAAPGLQASAALRCMFALGSLRNSVLNPASEGLQHQGQHNEI